METEEEKNYCVCDGPMSICTAETTENHQGCKFYEESSVFAPQCAWYFNDYGPAHCANLAARKDYRAKAKE